MRSNEEIIAELQDRAKDCVETLRDNKVYSQNHAQCLIANLCSLIGELN